jgi:hypothetical protein
VPLPPSSDVRDCVAHQAGLERSTGSRQVVFGFVIGRAQEAGLERSTGFRQVVFGSVIASPSRLELNHPPASARWYLHWDRPVIGD